MYLTMFNVKFGECIQVVANNKETLIIDCGTKNSKSIANNIAMNFYNQKFNRKSAMISHFDEDHISGFKFLAFTEECKDVFDKFYIPYVTIAEDSSGIKRSVILEVAIYLYLFTSVKVLTYKISEALLEHIEIVTALTKTYSNIYALSRGDNFIFYGKKFNVLWPDVHSSYFHEVTIMVNSITEIEDKLKDSTEFNEIKDLKNKMTENMIKWFSLIKDNNKNAYSESEKDIVNIVNEIVSKQKKYIKELERHKKRITNGEVSMIDSDDTSINRLKYFVTKEFYTDMNDTSIVCQSKKLKCLFAGDATNKVMKEITKNKDFLKKI